MTPKGKTLTQSRVENLHKTYKNMIILCGRYEGIDERIREMLVDIEISIGKYVLTGGELGAMTLIDAVARLIPNVLGNNDSHLEDSFSKALDRKKEYPQYTRPSNFMGHEVPEILLSGHHKKIEEWKKDNLT
jgi:tRNA (guanine37-N1)-methyltransferase